MPLLFQKERDLLLMRRYLKEQYLEFFTDKKYYKLRKDLTQVDELYKESESPAFDPPRLIRTYVDIEPREAVLDRYGLDERRDLLAILDREGMDRDGIRPEVGDVIVIETDEGLDKREYEVLEVHYQVHWGNTYNPFFWAVTCKLRHQSTVKDARVDTTINLPEDDIYA